MLWDLFLPLTGQEQEKRENKGKQKVKCTICGNVFLNETVGKYKNGAIFKHMKTAHEDKYSELTGKQEQTIDQQRERFERFKKERREKKS